MIVDFFEVLVNHKKSPVTCHLIATNIAFIGVEKLCRDGVATKMRDKRFKTLLKCADAITVCVSRCTYS